jgi:nucleotide-binding universal stress UspA family protein
LSDVSAHAAELAQVVAGYYGASVTAQLVLSPVLMAVPGLPTTTHLDPSVSETEFDRLRRDVAAQFGNGPANGRLDVEIDVGQPAARILERASALPADLVVMGTHGTSGFEHLVLGSVAEKVLRKATCPVITVPPKARATSRLPFRQLLCPVDFSDSSLAALQFAVSLEEQSGASLTVMHVLEWPWHEPPAPSIEELPREQGHALAEFRRYVEESGRKRLESAVPQTTGSRISTRLLNGKPWEQILAVAAQEQADLIVVGVHGRSAVNLAFFGSTTNQLVRQATCPVLTHRS